MCELATQSEIVAFIIICSEIRGEISARMAFHVIRWAKFQCPKQSLDLSDELVALRTLVLQASHLNNIQE